MRYKLLIILALGFLASFTSCKKSPLTIGKIVTETRALPDFKEVNLNDNISLTLVRSDTCYIEITTGENIIGNVTTEVSGRTLSICNTTTLNWTRPYDYELHATLYYKDITNFVFASSGTLDTRNNYIGQQSPDVFYRFEIDGGSGDVDLSINNCNNLHVVYQYGSSQLTIHGDNNTNFIIYKRSYGVIDARNYDAATVHVTTDSASDCYISASESIYATINNCGDIYYKGDPENIQVTYGEFAKGKLLPL